jgi:hypothetical protein
MRVCQGLISEGIEPLASEEKAFLKLRAGRNRRHIWIFVLGSVGYLALFLVVVSATFGVNLLSFVLLLGLLAAPILALNARTDVRALRSARCEWAEVFTHPLPEVAYDPQRRAEADADADPEYVLVVPPFRRLIPTGEVLRRAGERFDEPEFSPVYRCPADDTPPPAPRRRLTASETTELRRTSLRGRVRALVWALMGVVIPFLLLRNGVEKSVLAAVGAGVVGLVGILAFVASLVAFVDHQAGRDLQDGYAFADGREEKLTSGRRWRSDGVPALDRWPQARD